jgi:hypothetical protein
MAAPMVKRSHGLEASQLPLGQKHPSYADLIFPAQLAYFSIERLGAFFLFGGSRPWTPDGIELLLAYPAAQCL